MRPESLKQRVDKGCHSRALREYEKTSKEREDDDNW